MERLRQRADFVAASSGPRAPSAAFVVQARLRDDEGPARLGFTVSRKVGNAVKRNRARRRLREVVKRAPPDRLLPGHDYVVVARAAAIARPFDRMVEEFVGALHRLSAAKPRARKSSAGVAAG